VSPLKPIAVPATGDASSATISAAPRDGVTMSLAVPAYLDRVRMGWIDVDRMMNAPAGASGALEPAPDPEAIGSALALAGVGPSARRRAMSGVPGRFDSARVQME
jgi:hypothetical protein